MGMALKEDVIEACREAGTQKPIDLVFLSSATLGDRTLEKEILGMFLAHIPQYLEMIGDCTDPAEAKRVGHTIKGAARSIGALPLAELAEMAESEGEFQLEAIVAEMEKIRSYIADLTKKS